MASKMVYRFFASCTTIFIITALPGCTTVTTPAAEPISTAISEVCQPSQLQTSESGFSEIQGTMRSEGELWALLFFGKAHVAEELKMVWRITGTDEQFIVQGRHEDGAVISPIWGPEYHEDSNWERPGEEWGTSFTFPNQVAGHSPQLAGQR